MAGYLDNSIELREDYEPTIDERKTLAASLKRFHSKFQNINGRRNPDTIKPENDKTATLYLCMDPVSLRTAMRGCARKNLNLPVI